MLDEIFATGVQLHRFLIAALKQVVVARGDALVELELCLSNLHCPVFLLKVKEQLSFRDALLRKVVQHGGARHV